MPPKKDEASAISMANTKKEMLTAYQELLRQMEEKEKAELRPAQVKERKEKAEAVTTADSLATEDIGARVAGLKQEMGRALTNISDKLEADPWRKGSRSRPSVSLSFPEGWTRPTSRFRRSPRRPLKAPPAPSSSRS